MMVFQIPAMSCNHCVKAITQAIQSIDPQAKVIIDLPSKRVEIDSKQSRSALVQGLVAADYPPQE